VALSWVININGDTVVAIPGARNPTHAKLNAGAMQLKLSSEEMQTIDELSKGAIGN
jgi:diketogulonate reductase-like aldo/keto reductase